MHRGVAGYLSPVSSRNLIEKHRYLVDRNAGKISVRTGDRSLYDDLWSVGACALVSAAASFDPAQGGKFDSYAEFRIRGAMLDELRQMDYLPRRLRAKTTKAQKARTRLSNELGRDPEDWELAKDLGISLEELGELDSVSKSPFPIEYDLVSNNDGPEEIFVKKQRVNKLKSAILELPKRLQIILALRHDEELTFKEIASVMEVSEARAFQLHAQAMKLMKNYMSEED